MSKKYIFIATLALIVLLGAGCLLQGEPKDEVSKILLNLKRQSGIAFDEVLDVEFNWNLEQEGEVRGVSVTGKRMEALGISPDEPIKVKEFFEAEGFVIDIQNIVAGTIVGLDGYRKDSIVCVARGGVTGGVEGLEAEVVTEDVIVSCGELQVVESEDVAGLANPASVYCENKGGKLIHIMGVGGVVGYCILPDERVCQQWKFFYSEGGECESPEVKFESDKDCKSACEEAGELSGNCKLAENIEDGETNLGGCVVTQSLLCANENKCYCGCSH
ncbi:MAG: DUF333 domain-containing protein [Patescibacteria group bacterium]|nr:DUF333 domain-containing protein [Patescibacteria group bacterium]